MAQVGRKRYIHFRIADGAGVPVTGRLLSNFAVTFLRDGVACADPLTLVDRTAGLYCLIYLPSTPGQDFVELYDLENDLRIGDDEYVETTETLAAFLTQDTGGVGALKADVRQPQTFTLYVFKSEIWQSGNHTPLAADASTPLDAFGNWLISPLPVLRATYHIVLMNGRGDTHVIRPFLDLTQDVEAPVFPVVSGGGDTIVVGA